jgi:hypothetical protein
VSTDLKAHKCADRQICKAADKGEMRHGATSRMLTTVKFDLGQVGWNQKPDERFRWSDEARSRRWLARTEYHD